MLLAPLLQAAAAAPTVLVTERSWLETAALVAQLLVSLGLLVVLVTAALLLRGLHAALRELSATVGTLAAPLGATLDDTRTTLAALRDGIAQVRGPLGHAGETVQEASQRLRAAMARAETRLEQLDRRVDDAQRLLAGSLATVRLLTRGARVGAARLRRARAHAEAPPASTEAPRIRPRDASR